MQTICSDHGRLDERSLALHRAIAGTLAADPALIEKARGNRRRWQERHGCSSSAAADWERVLSGTPDQVGRFLSRRSARATRLRQSSPFTGIFTESERFAIYESHSARAYHPGGEPDLG